MSIGCSVSAEVVLDRVVGLECDYVACEVYSRISRLQQCRVGLTCQPGSARKQSQRKPVHVAYNLGDSHQVIAGMSSSKRPIDEVAGGASQVGVEPPSLCMIVKPTRL